MLRHKGFVFSTLFMMTASAYALNLQGYRFSDSYRYSLLDDSLHEKFDGSYVATASYGYVNSPLYYSDKYLHNYRKDIINGNNVLTGGFTYYLNRNVSLGLDLNAVHNTVFNRSYTTLADSVVKSKINLHRTKDFSFSLNPQIFVPTGKTANFSTMNSVGGALSGVVEKSFQRLHFLGSLGALSAKNNAYADVDHRQLLLAQLGVSYDVSEKMNVNLEAFRNTPLVKDTLEDEGKYFLTAKHKTTDRVSTYFGAGVSGWGDVQRKSYSGFVGLKFSEAPMVAATVAALPIQRQVSKAPTQDIYFEHDRFNLEDQEAAKLGQYVDFLSDAKDVSVVEIGGFASAVGPAPYNLRLSDKRAHTVKKFFIEHGIDESKLKTRAYGEDFPQEPVEAKNRKVDIKFNP